MPLTEADFGRTAAVWEVTRRIHKTSPDKDVIRRTRTNQSNGGDKKSEKAKRKPDVEVLPHPIDSGKSRDLVGQKVGVSGRAIDDATRAHWSSEDLLCQKTHTMIMKPIQVLTAAILAVLLSTPPVSRY